MHTQMAAMTWELHVLFIHYFAEMYNRTQTYYQNRILLTVILYYSCLLYSSSQCTQNKTSPVMTMRLYQSTPSYEARSQDVDRITRYSTLFYSVHHVHVTRCGRQRTPGAPGGRRAASTASPWCWWSVYGVPRPRGRAVWRAFLAPHWNK